MLTVNQKEILSGLMLGDGHLFIPRGGKNAILFVKRAITDSSYNLFHKEIFNDYCSDKAIFNSSHLDKRTNKIYYSNNLRSKASEDFTQIFNMWYTNKKKIIPNNLELTSQTIATWFADDGNITTYTEYHKNSNEYGKNYPNIYSIQFATNGFTFEEVEFLKELMFKKYGFNLNIKKCKSIDENNVEKIQYILICYSTENSKIILRDIDPYFPNGMNKKSNIWRSDLAELYINIVRPNCPLCNGHHVVKQGKYANNDITWICKICKKYFRKINFQEKIILPKPKYLYQKTI